MTIYCHAVMGLAIPPINKKIIDDIVPGEDCLLRLPCILIVLVAITGMGLEIKRLPEFKTQSVIHL